MSGNIPEPMLPHLLSGAMAVMYPSIYEGFVLPVLEAMACGAPAATSNRTSLPEVGGDTVLYVDIEEADDLASTIERLPFSTDLREKHRKLGLARAKLFSSEIAAAKMDSLLMRYL